MDAFGQALQRYSGTGQVVHGGDQVALVTPETVQAPHHEGVAGTEVVKDRFQLGAAEPGAGRAFLGHNIAVKEKSRWFLARGVSSECGKYGEK